jgi:hypothetical protein
MHIAGMVAFGPAISWMSPIWVFGYHCPRGAILTFHGTLCMPGAKIGRHAA